MTNGTVTVKDVLAFLETIAPQEWKMDWDNCGLLCGSPVQEVHRILVALDPFEDTVLEAEALGADLLVTHHPLIFRPLHAVTDETAVGRTVRRLIRSGISAVNAHTNLDVAPGGVNDMLAAALSLTDVRVLNPMGTDSAGQEYGLLRAGKLEQQSLADFRELVCGALGCRGLRYVDGGRPVNRIAVGGGACAGELEAVIRAGCDTFVTADVKYNQFWDARDAGISLIDAGHFYTENPVCGMLCRKLQAAFPQLDVRLSQEHRDCMEYAVPNVKFPESGA